MERINFTTDGRSERRAAAPRPGRGRRSRMWTCLAGLVLAAPVLAGDKSDEAVIPAIKTDAKETKAVKKVKKVKEAKKATQVKELGQLPPIPGSEEEQTNEKSDPGKLLDRPLDPVPQELVPTTDVPPDFAYEMDPPNGFTGRSSIIPEETPSADFVPIADRWRIGFPVYDRYDRGHAVPDDYIYEQGHWWDPYQQNVLKGDYPIAGQHTFVNITAASIFLLDARQTPVATGPFESTAEPMKEDFFGSPNQAFMLHNLKLSANLFHGDQAAFKPKDWAIQATMISNVNSISVDELAFVNPNVLRGVGRDRTFTALEEYFVECKLADTSPEYDFVSARVGSQFFSSDFRGFIYSDTNRMARVFGTRGGNRHQYNLVFARQAEKDTNTGLNTMDDRQQNIVIANYYLQDFIWPGYQITASIHYNNDHPTRRFDTNSFRARPDNAGVFQPHNLDVCYLGLGSDGHIDRYNISSQLYFAFGRDSQNPIANRGQDIRGYMASMELSYDRDWARFRTSFFWSSGDGNPNNSKATGFDAIFDSPNFAGGPFSYWQRQGIGLFGVNLTNRESLIPSLKASKIQGQSNFVNPGLLLFNLGLDMDITPRLKLIHNTNFLWFQTTKVLETFLFDGNIADRIGTDMSLGFLYRPLATNNIQFTLGVSTLVPGDGFKALYNNKDDTVDPPVAMFFQSVLQY